MRPQRARDPVPVHRPLAVGAVAYLFLIAAAGASLAHLGQRRLDEAALRSATTVVEADSRRSALNDARRRAQRSVDILATAEAAAHAVAEHLRLLGPSAVDTAEPPFEFEPVGSQSVLGFASEAHDIVGLAPDPDATAAELGALSWRGMALTVALRTARLQVAERTRFSVWVRDEGLISHPYQSAAALLDAHRLHAGFGGAVLSDPAEVDGWRTPFTDDVDREFAPYVLSLQNADGEAWAVVRVDVDLADVLPQLVLDDVGESAIQPVVLDPRGDVLAASPRAAAALGLVGTKRDADAAARRAITSRLAATLGPAGTFVANDDGTIRSGRDEFVALARVPRTNWTLAAIMPRSLIAATAVPASESTSRSIRDFSLAVFGFAAIFGVLAAVVGVGFADSLRRRLQALVDVARSHAAGRLEVRAPITIPDEIGAVGQAMNSTAGRMRENLRRLEESRRRLTGLIESMAEGLVITDAEDHITFANARFASVVKRQGDALVGHYLEEFLVPDSLDAYRAELRRRRDGGRSRHEVTWRNPGGDHPRTIVSAMSLFDADGRYTGTCCVVTDITVRARAQEETARAEKLRALGEMAGGVAHDFNNVLTAVLGNTQYLLAEELDDEVLETLRVIETAAMDGTETVNRIRKFTRPSAGVHDAGPVDANAAARDVLKMARPRFERTARERGVRYDVVLERNALRCVRGNAHEIREVLLNLVYNALDAMPDGGTLTVEAFDRGEDSVGLRVADSGHGIPEENVDKIFDPFFSTKRGGRCSGLGLSICFGIARAHGGRIDVRSEPGNGTTFTVVVPAFTQEEAPAAVPELPAEPRVLLVSPHRQRAQSLQKALNALGLHVALVETPSVGLDLASDRAIFNTLVVEHGQGAGGWELARAARRARADLRIVVLTDAESPIDDTQARNAGIDRVLARPFAVEDVQGVILSVLAKRALHAGQDRETAADATSRARAMSAKEAPTYEVWGADKDEGNADAVTVIDVDPNEKRETIDA